MENTSKLKIKIGNIELEYEGQHSFLKDDFIETMKQVIDLQSAIPETVQHRTDETTAQPQTQQSGEVKLNQSVTTIANLLNADSGPTIAIAAAAYLNIVESKTSFNRKDLLATMKNAHGRYKETYSSNLTKTINQLTKADKFRVNGNDAYTLSHSEITRIKGILQEDNKDI